MMPRLLTVAILIGAVCASAPAWAQAPALPDAASILERSIEAQGGREALEGIHNRVTHGSMKIPAMGLSGTVTSYSAAPNLFYSVAELAGLGKLESGSDGEIFWESTAMTGPRVKAGEERAMALREARFNGMLNWHELYKDAQTAGIDTVDARPCFKLILTPHEGSPETQWYDSETYLLRKSEMKMTGEMGTIPIVNFVDDYRDADGVRMAFKARTIVMGIQEMIFETERVEHNVEIPAERFALPADIQALVAKESVPADSE